MDLVERPKSALCQFDLLAQLLDPNEPKTEREHAAVREIARLRRALDDLGVTPQEARSGAERSKAKDEEITRLRTRLEIIPGTEIDGIDCRDETIRMQDAEIGRLRLVEGAQAAADERLANAAQRVGFIAGCDSAEWMADEIERLRADAAECDALRTKLADILTRTANELKGYPGPLSLHSWHDLPECAQNLRKDVARWRDYAAMQKGE